MLTINRGRCFLWIVVFSSLALSCRPPVHPNLQTPFSDDTTYTDIRKDAFQILTAKLNLPVLKNKVTGFEMRIWAPMGGHDNLNLLTLKYDNRLWTYTSTQLVLFQPNSAKDSLHPMLRIRIDSIKKVEIKPVLNEAEFLDSLQSLALQFSPKQQEWEEGLQPDTQNFAYTFEIANRSSYRMFTFTCAGREQGPTDYDRKVVAFLGLLKKHFGFAFEDCQSL